jgi:hypothetical protein
MGMDGAKRSGENFVLFLPFWHNECGRLRAYEW